MGVSYSTRKCESCAGSLEYIRDKKIWRCRYCGLEVVREEKYDGLFTIKNVVRQTIVDAAYRRIDGARNNLTECQKIDANYVGTVIARICFRMVCLITPGGCREEEVRGMYQRLKDDYLALQARDDGIGEDEETLYEFLRDSDAASDAFALLVLVFDSLGDNKRAEYCYELLELPKVYSKECNKDLLSYCLKNGRTGDARTIAANRGSIDPHSALDIVLAKCPDGDEKRDMIGQLLQQNAYRAQDKNRVRDYLQGGDSCATKAALLAGGKDAGFLPEMDTLIRHVLEPAAPEETELALSGIPAGQLHDSDLYELLSYGLSGSTEKAMAIVRHIKASGRFVSLNSGMIQKLFLDPGRPAQERLALWNELSSFRIEKKTIENAAAEYLCRGADSPADRNAVLDRLLERAEAIPPSVVERYLLQCRADGAQKAQMIRRLFSLQRMHPAQFGGILGQYLASWPDEPADCVQVTDALLEAGLTLTPNDISSFICSNRRPDSEKVEMLRRLEKNGCRPRADALSTYLERCADRFSSDLFSYLFDKSTAISETALKNYLLVCHDDAAVKVRNAVALSQKQAVPFGASSCQIVHGGRSLSCSLAQAYLLLTTDALEMASEMLKEMTRHVKLAADITADGSVMRFKKYLKEYRSQLSETASMLCEQFNLFSLF